ncbi:MAG: MDR family MFS transporter [Betaproteobacteria bacterium]
MFRLKTPEPYRGLPNSVYVLFFANVVNHLGNFVWPLLTLYLTERLGFSKHGAGELIMLSAAAAVPGSLLGGRLADRLGRKRLFVVSRTLAALTLGACAFLRPSLTIAWLLIAQSLLGAASDPALRAMVADLTNRENRQAANSLLYLGINLGFAVGPALAGFLYRRHLPWLFLGDAFTTLLSVSLVAALVKETLPDQIPDREAEEDVPPEERAERGGLLAALGKRPALVRFAATLGVYHFVSAQAGFALPVQAREVFGADGPALYGILMSVNALTVIALTAFVTRWTSHLDPACNMALGGAFYAFGFGMLFLVRRFPLFILSTVVWTVGEILVATNSGVYIANHSPLSHRARFSSVLSIVSGTGWAIGPNYMGRVIDRLGVRAVWPVAFSLGLGGAAVMFALWVAEGVQRRARDTRSAY